jgi:anti-sigma regulatory factor (Ser/Thr protein kinase)
VIAGHDAGTQDHVVHFYARDEDLAEHVGRHLVDALAAGATVIVAATHAHADAFEQRIRGAGIELDGAIATGAYLRLDADALLPQLLADGSPDPQRFDAIIGSAIRTAAVAGRPIYAYGELVGLLWNRGRVNAAIELEALWNALGREIPFSLFCSYPAAGDSGEERVEQLSRICNLHTAVVGDDPRGPSIRHFEAASDAPRAARRFLAERLGELSSEQLVLDATLIVTELATNAVQHARSAFTVAIMRSRGALRIEVRDASTLAPVVRRVDPWAGSGRGLALVEALAHAWGVEYAGNGKTVWAQLAAPAAA